MDKQSKPVITGCEGAAIEVSQAASWTKNYRDKSPGQPISQFFGKEILEKILSQEGCLGIRFYYALDHDGKEHLIITGAMSDGSDQIGGKEYEAPRKYKKECTDCSTTKALYRWRNVGTMPWLAWLSYKRFNRCKV